MVLELVYDSGYREYLKLVRIENVDIRLDPPHPAPIRRVKMWCAYPRQGGEWYSNAVTHYSGRYLREHSREMSPLEVLILFGEA